MYPEWIRVACYFIGAGFLAGGILQFSHIAGTDGEKAYYRVAILELVLFAFVAAAAGAELSTLLGDPAMAFVLEYIREFAGILTSAALSFFVVAFIRGPRWIRRTTTVLGYLGLASFAVSLAGALIAPASFLSASADSHGIWSLSYGPLFSLSQVYLGIVLLYSFGLLLMDSLRWKSFPGGWETPAGAAIAIYLTISSIFKELLGFYIDPLFFLDYSRSIVGPIFFGAGATIGFSRMFLSRAQEARTHIDSINARLADLVIRDELTGLPNRRAFFADLTTELPRIAPAGASSAIVLFDLDGFMALNQSYGDEVGDGLLRAMQGALADVLPPRTDLYRLGGDEFALIIRGVAGEQEAIGVAEAIKRRMLSGLETGGETYSLDAAFAVLSLPKDGTAPADVLSNAYSALDEAKKRGTAIRPYDEESRNSSKRRISAVSGIRKALRDRRLRLVYQPIVDWRGAPIGAEALLRWDEGGSCSSPAFFIPLAESAGLMCEMGSAILSMLLDDLGGPLRAGTIPPIAVNISPMQLLDEKWFAVLESDLRNAAVPSGQLNLEVTESMLVDVQADTIKRLDSLRDLGVRVSIDDFGTGYSNLSYLQSLPVDKIKLDKSFITAIPGERSAEVLVRAVADICRSFKLGLLAEGVETEKQFSFLKRCGYYEFQGYLFSKPLRPEEYLSFLTEESFPMGELDEADVEPEDVSPVGSD